MFSVDVIVACALAGLEMQADMEDDARIMALPPEEQNDAWIAQHTMRKQRAAEREERRKEAVIERRHQEVVDAIKDVKMHQVIYGGRY